MTNAPARRISVMPPGHAELEESDAEIGRSSRDGAVIEEGGEEAASKAAKLPARAVRNDDGSYTLPLLKPVELKIKKSGVVIRTENVDELRLRELTGADMRIILQASADMQPVTTLARAADIATQRMVVIFDNMGARDIAAATAIVSFLSE